MDRRTDGTETELQDHPDVGDSPRRGLKVETVDPVAFRRQLVAAQRELHDPRTVAAFRQWKMLPAAERRRYEDWTPRTYALHVRKLTASPRPRAREHRPSGSRRVGRARSRSPDRLDEPPPDLDQGTALQRGWQCFLDGLEIVKAAGRPVLVVWLDLAAIRVAAELAPLLRWREKDAA